DVNHTFKKEHKLQIQSTCFPLIDVKPQTCVSNIFKAGEGNSKKQTHKIFNDSSVEFKILE
ncbi:MAG: hypothetical protein ACI93P_002344, partial [bacterium]